MLPTLVALNTNGKAIAKINQITAIIASCSRGKSVARIHQALAVESGNSVNTDSTIANKIKNGDTHIYLTTIVFYCFLYILPNLVWLYRKCY